MIIGKLLIINVEEKWSTVSRLRSITDLFEVKIKKTLCLCASVAMFSAISIFSQETNNNQYSHIKQLIISKQLSKAREEIKLAMTGNENDPTLNLYQTELWIAEGDFYYSSGQYKRALEIYEKAIERYPSNPMVKMKYQEMVNKMKGIYTEQKENKPSETLPVQPLGLQGGLPIQNSESMQGTMNGNNTVNFSISRTDFLLTIVCLQNFILLLFLFLRLPKRVS